MALLLLDCASIASTPLPALLRNSWVFSAVREGEDVMVSDGVRWSVS